MKLKKLILLLSGTALAIGLASSNAMAYEQDRREHRDMQSHGDRYPAREHHEDRDRHDHRDYRQAERRHHHWYRPEPGISAATATTGLMHTAMPTTVGTW